MAVGLEDQRVALDGAGNLAAAREAELAVELAGVVEEDDAFRLLGDEVLGLGEEPEVGVALDDAFQCRDQVGLGLDVLGSGALLLLPLLPKLLRGFGDEEGGGEWRIEKRKKMYGGDGAGIGLRVR